MNASDSITKPLTHAATNVYGRFFLTTKCCFDNPFPGFTTGFLDPVTSSNPATLPRTGPSQPGFFIERGELPI
jgi:hypothetical protein